MSSAGRLRPLRWTDLGEVVSLELRTFPTDAWDEASWWSELAQRPRRDYTVLEGDSAALWGYAGLDLAGEVADVMTIAVDPRRRGSGHGARLLQHLLARASDAGARHLMLELRADNAPAQALYRRFGFQVVRTRTRYYQPEDVDALVMRAELSRA